VKEKNSEKQINGRYSQIGCATRGGAASRATEDKAIALACQYQAELIFLYVVDVAFAHGHSGKFPIDIVDKELHEIGEIVLQQAKLRAKECGVNARSEIRSGHVGDEIERFVVSHKSMALLVVGHLSHELREHLEPVLTNLAQRHLDVIVVSPD
jgi:nucleotide-binding universal stress UspA family protein